MDIQEIQALIRDVPDFPEPGIIFRDITPVLADPIAFSTITDLIVVHFGRGQRRQGRGHRGARVHPRVARRVSLRGRVRAHPEEGQAARRRRSAWTTSWSTARPPWSSTRDAIEPGERVLIVDDVLATGGTARAAVQLVEQIGGEVYGIACVIELDFLKGREQIPGHELHTLIHY